jgi:hypothetical protein
VTGALCQAHIDAVDDWIPINQYLDIRAIARKKKFKCRGPDFLMRAYAKASGRWTACPNQVAKEGEGSESPSESLAFRGSSVVAAAFVIQPVGLSI